MVDAPSLSMMSMAAWNRPMTITFSVPCRRAKTGPYSCVHFSNLRYELRWLVDKSSLQNVQERTMPLEWSVRIANCL
jgi:hypothetical protein